MRRILVALAFTLLASQVARAEDTQPPIIRHAPVSKATKGDAVAISADMEDESEIFAPTLYFRYPGAKNYSSIPMTKKGGATYVATVQATADVEYWIEAYDEFGNGPAREGAPERPHKVTVTEKVVSRPAVAARVEPKPEPPPPPPPPPAVEPPPVVEAPPPEPPAVEPAPFTEPPVAIEDQKPIYKEWWFIGGSVAVTAAVVTVAAIALQPDPIYRNTFSANFKRPAAP